jgi:hypothetical protein
MPNVIGALLTNLTSTLNIIAVAFIMLSFILTTHGFMFFRFKVKCKVLAMSSLIMEFFISFL